MIVAVIVAVAGITTAFEAVVGVVFVALIVLYSLCG